VPGAQEARRWARDELAEAVYRQAEPGLVDRAVGWLLDRLAEVDLPTAPGSRVWLVAGLLALAALAVAALRLAGPLRPRARRAASPGAVFDGAVRTAAAHRDAADEHAASGRWEQAVRERFRALVRSLEERALLVPTPGRTADELAREAGRLLPAAAEDLAAAAGIFDDVWYGGRTATAEDDARLRDVDAVVASASPAPEPAR
jgi:hypothetical protein